MRSVPVQFLVSFFVFKTKHMHRLCQEILGLTRAVGKERRICSTFFVLYTFVNLFVPYDRI